MQRLAQHVPLVPIAEGLLWHTLAWWRALFMPAAFAGGVSIKANNLSDCRQQTTVPNSALPCCRFMCTPHWQLFYLGVSTVLGGQGSVPQLANTSLCCSLLLRLLNVEQKWLSLIWAHAHGWQNSSSVTHHICTAAPRLKSAAAPHLMRLL